MKTILIAAYAINPYQGSEDAMGWNFVMQAARFQNVIAVTRKNNRADIEKFIAENPSLKSQTDRIRFLYYDWNKALLYWKKGPILSLIYFYFWSFCVALFLKREKLNFDIAHHLNFHNDWTPTFLWLLGKPFVWGPVGHHPKIKNIFLSEYDFSAKALDRFLWILKNIFWKLDPFLKIARNKAACIWYMHHGSVEKLKPKNNFFISPSIAAEEVDFKCIQSDDFVILSIGRFVALKGFDVTIKSFAKFYHNLSSEEKLKTKLVIVGTGKYKLKVRQWIAENNIENAVEVHEWMPREQLKNIYKQAALFFFPSHEGAGMVVAEAMSADMPVLCWNNFGPGEITHPDSKLKVDYPENYQTGIDAFAEKLHQIFSDKNFYQAEQILAHQRFQSLLKWNVRGEQLKEMYESVNK